MILKLLCKYALLFIILINPLIINDHQTNDISYNRANFGQYSLSSLEKKISKTPEIYITITDISYSYSKIFNIIETVYYLSIYDQNFYQIKPSDLSLKYHIGIFCNFYTFETNENIYSIANIQENRCFYCIEHTKIGEHAKFGIKIYKINDLSEEIEYNDLFFFTDKLINIENNPENQNNNKFDNNYLDQNFKNLVQKINQYKKQGIFLEESNNLKSSYLQPPLSFLKRDITRAEGKWYFKNVYENYFCFCKGESCINNLISYTMYNFQSCKYFFYLTILDNNKNLYPKTDYLLSDFFEDNIEPSEAFPIFQEMIKRNLKAHYLTMSWGIYSRFCKKNEKCLKNLRIIYGVKRIDGDILEKYLELFLKLKAVIAAEKYASIDNLFYNIDYIIYIFLGHGVTYVKSYLYNDYLSPKRYNKILIPPSERFISLAILAGWKNEDIIKIGYPKWDYYEIHSEKALSYGYSEENERSIFMMFTWRKIKKGKKASFLYYDNIINILNDTEINEELYLNNVKLFFCYHHTLKEKKIMDIGNNTNIRFISQNEISLLLKNSSLIITDFSSILFDAIVQRKPLILFIPDGLDNDLQDIYDKEYYETINKIKNGVIYLGEVFFELGNVIDKIIYYIKNNFILESERLKFYKMFRLRNRDNTKKFINYLLKLK